MMLRLLALLLAIASTTAFSQEEVFELSPFSVSRDRGIPPVTIKRTGDNLVLKIHLLNDSRVYEQREQELYATIEDMVSRASIDSDIVLHSGEFQLDERNYKVKLSEATQRSDTTYADLFAKIPLSNKSNVAELSDKLRQFAESTVVVGRTEVFPNQIGISIVDPEKYRYDVLEAIATDLNRTKAIFGEDHKVIVSGLDQRVQWRRTSISEIEIYIPYEFIVAPLKIMEW